MNSAVEHQNEEHTPLLQKQAGKHSVPPKCCSVRSNLAFMMFLGFAVVYGLRVNLSVAMVAMVNATNGQPTSNGSEEKECPAPSGPSNTSHQNPDQPDGVPQYSWDPETQGMLLGAFFFGYLFTQIPGGYLSGRFGGSIFLGGGVLGTAVLTLLTPLAAQLGPSWLFALRALEGFGEGVTFPAQMAMWACWAPPLERARLTTFSGAGSNFGAFVALPLTGFICNSLGWPAVFYCFGGAGCLWAVLWFILVSDEPRTHRRISDQEKDYIINSIGSEGGSHGWSVPLLPMLLSVPLWAIIITQMCANWSYYTLLTSLPTYMDTVLHFDLRQNSFLSALPYLGAWLFSILSGVLADSLLEREILSITTVRKIFTLVEIRVSIGLLLPAGFLFAVGFTGCSSTLAVTFLTVSTTIGGISAAGVFMNQIDIAPRYAGMLLGITNTFGTIPGVLAPIAVGHLAKNRSLVGWRNVFCLSAGVSAIGALVFTLFGSGRIQRWAVREHGTDADREH
ncbi:sialin isoform X1 [Electrophorus electricus]|uniref:sialin isoform X1 n=2 Tax=Electrophorus electricus TaxID=8005 RepID=UPI000F0A1EB4|nr:sialin isoform X1 [Electrophorus electricus]XP_035385382.1 sialin isoform X1 [Electrophorus electricus]XP_035385383.1 sialin isoform X1 [Electrophorus electricus]